MRKLACWSCLLANSHRLLQRILNKREKSDKSHHADKNSNQSEEKSEGQSLELENLGALQIYSPLPLTFLEVPPKIPKIVETSGAFWKHKALET